ncbi:MAG: peroxide stress protein YaaA [Deltaproteobacteria bacterium]|nr:peroxide stress protein YaaA [Deltaproteobacteria bacterium]
MLALLSPAKALDPSPPPFDVDTTSPALMTQSEVLMQTTSKLSKNQIQDLMHLSETLAKLNWDRYRSFSLPFTDSNSLPAVFTFNGEVYRGLDARSLDAKALVWAQDHLGILSGLYGLLRPLDLMQPYRLEMGTKLKNPRGKNLYEFWDTGIAHHLDKHLEGHDDKSVVNLASNEYFKSVKTNSLCAPVVTCVFEDWKTHRDEGKVISFTAKHARGLMARFMIQERIDHVEGLKDFNLARYAFRKDRSTDDKYVFSRKFIPVAKASKKKQA